jgi:phosphatidylinositol 3-kinase
LSCCNLPTQFLRCIEWDEPAEAKQALELLEKWDPIDVDDALELLGKHFTAREVRSYAVSRLDSADAEELCLYLLQLVQALKYEPLITADGRVEMAAVLGAAALDGGAAAPAPPGGKTAGRGAAAMDEPDEGMDAGTPVGVGLAPTSLAGFLVKRALADRRLGSFLYWYLLVECKDKGGASTRLFTRVYSELVHALESGTPDQRDLRFMLKRQKDFLAGIRNVSNDLQQKSAGNRLKKIETLKTILRDTPQVRRTRMNFTYKKLHLLNTCLLVVFERPTYTHTHTHTHTHTNTHP